MEIQLWRSILCPYELAVKELTVKFEHMIEEYRENDRYSPIEQVSGRVKSVSSILEKLQRKHIPIEKMETEVERLQKIIVCLIIPCHRLIRYVKNMVILRENISLVRPVARRQRSTVELQDITVRYRTGMKEKRRNTRTEPCMISFTPVHRQKNRWKQ